MGGRSGGEKVKKLRMVADKDGREVILSEYRGSLDGLINIRVEEIEERCCEDSGVRCCG